MPSNEEEYSYNIELLLFLESIPGITLISKIKQQIQFEIESNAAIMQKIKTPEQYKDMEAEFITRQQKISALQDIFYQYLDPIAIKQHINSLKKKLEA